MFVYPTLLILLTELGEPLLIVTLCVPKIGSGLDDKNSLVKLASDNRRCRFYSSGARV